MHEEARGFRHVEHTDEHDDREDDGATEDVAPVACG
jgi:hypothetical protein